MPLFEKREIIFDKRDKAGWLKAKEALKAAGIRGVRGTHYEVEPPVCGCGSKLDPRDFGPKGKIDRQMYRITLPAEEAERGRRILEELGVECGIRQL